MQVRHPCCRLYTLPAAPINTATAAAVTNRRMIGGCNSCIRFIVDITVQGLFALFITITVGKVVVPNTPKVGN